MKAAEWCINRYFVLSLSRYIENEREDELLNEVDKQYEKIFLNEKIIKDSEKLPNKIKVSLEKGKSIEKEWNDENKLNSLINDCINIENNIKDIYTINENIKNFNSNKYINFKFNPEEDELQKYLITIKN